MKDKRKFTRNVRVVEQVSFPHYRNDNDKEKDRSREKVQRHSLRQVLIIT